MKQHEWSHPVCIYEMVDGVVCRRCKATILIRPDETIDDACLRSELPLDCNEAVPVVIHEEYDEWDDGFWMDEEPRWD